ncbi:MAG: polysaccharide pyruvyl transferase family protein [Bdellovibrionota bacterium]
MIKNFFNPDVMLQKMMGMFIYFTKKKAQVQSSDWQPGQPLKILFAGYAGARNTGGDVRVEEMIRQVRHILGDENIDLSILTIDQQLTRNYFEKVRQVRMPEIFPPFLYQECPKHHGVIACEGSMFKSKFADALSTMMAGSLGMANAEGKLSVGYGAEAGFMNPPLKKFVKEYCKDSLVICRNKASEKILEDFNIRTSTGTDTAWTFRPSAKEKGQLILQQHGWDGKTKILALSPIHPFCWPVSPSIKKSFERFFWNKHKEQHYKSVYFHHTSPENERQYQDYIKAIANAAKEFQKTHDVFPIIIGMEKLDRKACEALASEFPTRPPLFVSDEYNMYDMVSILRCSSMLVTSRFHAVVCSMGGLVPSAGITMDERIRNMMIERGHEHLLLTVDEDGLQEKLTKILETLYVDAEKFHTKSAASFRQLKLMGEMGMTFEDEVRRLYPDFPFKQRIAEFGRNICQA